MTGGLSLRTKLFLLGLLNAVLLAAVLVWFTTTQLTQNLGSFLIGEARDRLTAVAVQVGAELPQTPIAGRNALLAAYGAKYGVTFHLVTLDGTIIAGPVTPLPAGVKENLTAQRIRTPLLDNPENLARIVMQSRSDLNDANRFAVPPQSLERMMAVVDDPPYFAIGEGAYWVGFKMPLRAKDDPLFAPGNLLLSTPSFVTTPLFFDAKPWAMLAAMIAGVGVLCWLPFVRAATGTIRALAEATERVAGGAFAVTVNAARSDELGQLARSFAVMARQLESLQAAQKTFLRDTAHELRSPLARMQAALGNLLEGGQKGPGVAQLLEDVREEIDQMSTLTGELLALARADAARAHAPIAPINLRALAMRAADTENAIIGADVRVTVDDTLSVAAHEPSLLRAQANVLRNAIRYAADAGPVTIAADRRDDAVILTVADRGPGVPEAALGQLFTPFFRVDPSRDRRTGGTGVGLAIAKACVETCGGSISCRNGNPGLSVVITLRAA